MKIILHLFYILFSFQIISAQNNLTEIDIDKELHEIAQKFNGNLKEEERLLLKLKSESERIGYDDGIFQSSDYLMALYLEQSRDEEVIKLGTELKRRAENKEDQYGFITSMLSANAIALGNLGFYDASLKDFKKAISYAEDIKDIDKKNYLLSRGYQRINQYYSSKRLEDNKMYDTILYNYKKSLDFAKKIKDDSKSISTTLKYSHIIFINIRLGVFYLEQANVKENIELAESYLMEALRVHENKVQDLLIDTKVMLLNQISWLYMEKIEYQKSIDFAQQALKYEKQFSNPYHRIESFEFLATGYMEAGDKETSRFYMDKYIYLKDSINLVEKNTTNRVAKKLVENVSFEHNKNLKKILFIIGVLSMVTILFTVIFWRRRNKVLLNNYEKVREKLQNHEALYTHQNSPPVKDLVGQQSKQHYNKITNETEQRILKDLESFEQSEIFLNKDFNSATLANNLNTNTRYLSEVIKNHKSQNFSDYINGLKINYILHKLYSDPQYREYKISYLAEVCGYSSGQRSY